MPRFMALALLVLSTSLFAQRGLVSARPPTPRAPTGRFSPPARVSADRTASDRSAQAAQRLAASKRRGVRGDRGHDGEEPGGLGPKAAPLGGHLGALLAMGRIRVLDAAKRARAERSFLRKLQNRLGRTRDESLDWDIRTFSEGTSRRFRVAYAGIRRPGGTLLHRVTVHEVQDSRSVLVDRLLIRESPGVMPRGWRLAEGKAVLYSGNPLMYPIGGTGFPLGLIDILPFHPGRSLLELVGIGRQDGRAVLHFNARPLVARGESQCLVFRQDVQLLVREVAHHRGRVSRKVSGSGVKRHRGSPTLEYRSVRFETGELASVSLIKRRINSKLCPSLFEPSALAR